MRYIAGHWIKAGDILYVDEVDGTVKSYRTNPNTPPIAVAEKSIAIGERVIVNEPGQNAMASGTISSISGPLPLYMPPLPDSPPPFTFGGREAVQNSMVSPGFHFVLCPHLKLSDTIQASTRFANLDELTTLALCQQCADVVVGALVSDVIAAALAAVGL